MKRLGMTTVGMPGHGFTFPVEGIVPVIFSSMGTNDLASILKEISFSKEILTN
jgi:hypothetical protein